MAKRKIRDHADAHECLAMQAASGLTLAVWARQEGIDGRSLNLWRVNLTRHHGRPPRPAKLVELIPAPLPPAPRYTIRCRDMAVEVADDFDQDALLRILQVVAAC